MKDSADATLLHIPWRDRLHTALRLPYLLDAVTRPGQRPTIVLLHGVASSSATWEPLMNELETASRIVAIDLLGFGDSPKPLSLEYNVNDHVRSLHFTLRRLGIVGPVIMVGHSMGALIAVSYAARHPAQVKQLVLCSMPLYTRNDVTSRSVIDSWLDGSSNLYMRAYAQLRSNAELTIRSVQLLAKLRIGDMELDPQTWYPFSRSLEHTIERQETARELAALTCPITLLFGQFDGLLIHPYLTRLARDHDNVTVRRLPAAHMINRPYVKAIAKALTEAA